MWNNTLVALRNGINVALIKYEGFPVPDPIISRNSLVACLFNVQMQSS